MRNASATAVVMPVNSTGAEFPTAAAFHAVALGSPVQYGNPSPASLQWLDVGLGPGWGNGFLKVSQLLCLRQEVEFTRAQRALSKD